MDVIDWATVRLGGFDNARRPQTLLAAGLVRFVARPITKDGGLRRRFHEFRRSSRLRRS
jgi:hypothetical protein